MLPCMLWLRDFLTGGLAQLQPDVVKAFLRSGERRAALWHGAMIKKTGCEEEAGVLGETSLLIRVPTCDSGWVALLPRMLIAYLPGGVIALLSIQGVFEKVTALQAGRRAGVSAREQCGESRLLHEVERAEMRGEEGQAGAADLYPGCSYTSSLWCGPASDSDVEEETAPRCLLLYRWL